MKHTIDIDLRFNNVEAEDETDAMNIVQDELTKMGIDYVVTREELADTEEGE